MSLFEVGEVILNRFEIIDILGEGAFSVVFKAKNLRHGGEVALKQAKPDDMADLEKEFNIHKKLAPYEFAPTLIEYNESPDHGPFLVMSIEGQSVLQRHRIHGKDFSNLTILLLLYHALIAIKKLHAVGYCHFDMNLGNVAEAMTKNKTRLILLDFELAQEYYPGLAQQDIEQIFSGLQLIARSHKRLNIIYQMWSNKKNMNLETLLAVVEESDGFDKDALFDWE